MKKIILIFILILSTQYLFSQNHIITGGDKKLWDGMGLIGIDEIKVSSTLLLKNQPANTYDTFKLDDGDPGTAWVEGVKGSGIGEWIKIKFDGGHITYRMIIINGLAKNKEFYFANNRVKKLLIEYSEGQKKEVILKDGVLDYQSVMLDKIYATWIKLTILEVYKGSKYDDTCIAEIHLDHWDKD